MDKSDPAQFEQLQSFVEEAKISGGSELANYQLFIERLCNLLGVAGPVLSREQNAHNDYVFERRVDFKHPDGKTTAGRIDLYKRDCFILEAKQSAKRNAKKPNENQLDLIPEDEKQLKLGQAKRGTRSWDKVMVAARKQAEDYARALPVEHGYPPFLLVLDIGNVIEVYADFSGQGKNYAHFPDRQSYRIGMDDLLKEDIQQRLISIWTDPLSLDPAKKSAEVTRDIAERLARIAKRLEDRYDPKEVAEFLMRCLFTMFAEDVKLIPENSFQKLLYQMKATPENFVPALESLWKVMDTGGYAPHLNTTLKRFNGALFKNCKALPIDHDDIQELFIAANRNWQDVEPAIFGTLLERALNARERSKLGAHYTPRTYVERLVIPTIIEPLRSDWEAVQTRVRDLLESNQEKEALRAVRRFHRQLCTTRVLDPACGTGNFLYVSLELMKRLEGEVLETITELGGQPDRYQDYPDETGRDLAGQKLVRSSGRFSVDPHQFYGLEINPRAVPIADLVLWIGYLKWQIKTSGVDAIAEPVLDAYGTIKEQDAIIAYDSRETRLDNDGNPITRWDGATRKPHPITGEMIPDETARVELFDYKNPKIADWPETEFIVGNPPFIGGKDMREELGDGYAEACWKVRPKIPGGADFVMHFWDEAARRLLRKPSKQQPNSLRRFGFITTNSITQTFSRRVIEQHMAAKLPLSLIFAVPDHPWMKASDKAAVRIAMTVAEAGDKESVLGTVLSEADLNSDAPKVKLERKTGKIWSDFTIGADFSILSPLLSNQAIAHKGFMPYGKAFFITEEQARTFGLGTINDAECYIRPYVNGRDLNQRRRGVYALDFHEKSEEFVRKNFSSCYQYLLDNSKPERENNKIGYRKKYWWRFGQPSSEMRHALTGIPRYIGTSETAKHRMFRFLESSIAPDQKIRVIASSRVDLLSLLSSRVHVIFSNSNGGKQGVGNDPVYQHTKTFDPFPFPDFDALPKELTDRLEDLGERLDALRKDQIAKNSFLTMTGLYNVLERSRELDNGCDVPPITDAERDVYDAGLVSILKEIHDDIDKAVLEAYGCSDLAPALVGKPGATTPSPHKTAVQEEAEQELLLRLVALNQERAAEEQRGIVRWLRPDYQIPALGHKIPKPKGEQVEMLDVTVVEKAEKEKWPSDGLLQIRLVRDALSKETGPAAPEQISAAFKGGRNRTTRIQEVLDHMVETGLARQTETDGNARYFMPR